MREPAYHPGKPPHARSRLARSAAIAVASALLLAGGQPAVAGLRVPHDDPSNAGPHVLDASRGLRTYGPAVNIDARSNRRVTGSRGLSHRFRANATAKVPAILFQPRWGGGYSAGDGGRYRVSIQADDGTSNHFPSGRQLAAFVWRPGNSGNAGYVRRFTFPKPATLRKGRIYHVVFRNIHDRPDSNYISINEAYTYETYTPRQPRFPSGMYAVLNGEGSGRASASWSVDRRHTPVMDLVYANGKHQGMAYLGALIDEWGAIGGERMVRERFRVSGPDRRVTAACVRIGRQRGEGALTIRLERGSGRAIESVRVPSASRVSYYAPGSNGDNGDWVCGRFSGARVLQRGRTYNLELSAPSGTQYSMTPILARDYTTSDKPYHMRSWHFREGTGQKSTDGGRSWRELYASYPQNTQFYLRLG